MTKTALSGLALCLLFATTASAQSMGGGGGGFGGGGGGGHHGHGGQGVAPSTSSAPPAAPGAPARSVAPDKADIIGVIKAIDPATDRVTIEYQANDALNWPAGTTPFVVAKSALLKDVAVGEKVRFRLESQQVYVLQPYAAAAAAAQPAPASITPIHYGPN